MGSFTFQTWENLIWSYPGGDSSKIMIWKTEHPKKHKTVKSQKEQLKKNPFCLQRISLVLLYTHLLH